MRFKAKYAGYRQPADGGVVGEQLVMYVLSSGGDAVMSKRNNANAHKTGADWRAAFAFEIVGTIFLLWMMVMAYQVNRDDFD